ncbi:MAG: hypothetical protein ACOYNN_12320, partial [Terrimicrobiaceae bacterium]
MPGFSSEGKEESFASTGIVSFGQPDPGDFPLHIPAACIMLFRSLQRPYRPAVRTPPFHGGNTG